MVKKAVKKATTSTSKMQLGVSEGFRTYALDQLEGLGDVTARSMFGGIGLYHGDLFFGLIARDVLYLRVDDLTRGEYEAAGMTGFQPYPGRAEMSTNYFEVPVAVLEDPVTLTQWARRAVDVAARAPKTKKRTTSRKTSR